MNTKHGLSLIVLVLVITLVGCANPVPVSGHRNAKHKAPPLPPPPSKLTKASIIKAGAVKSAAAEPGGQFVSVARYGINGFGQAACVDAVGNVFIGGTVDSKPFLVKRSPGGAEQWRKEGHFSNAGDFKGTGSGTVMAMATDGEGNVWITGHVAGQSMDFGGGPINYNNNVIFLVKYSSSGAHLFSRTYGGSMPDPTIPDSGRGIAVDLRDNSVVLVGYFQDSVDFGGGTFSGGHNMFIAKFSSDGTHQWSKNVGYYSSGNSAAIDNDGTIFVTGTFAGTVNFGAGPISTPANFKTFLARYSPEGALAWVATPPEGFQDEGLGVALDHSGHAFITGHFESLMNFAAFCSASPSTCLTNAGFQDIFLAKFSTTDGSHIWSKRFGAGAMDYGYGVAADNDGSVFLTGKGRFKEDFGGNPIATTPNDAFVAKFNAAGGHQWSRIFGAGFESGNAVAVNSASGHVIGVGTFANTVDFGGGPVSSSGGTFNIFGVEYTGAATNTPPPPGPRPMFIVPFEPGYWLVGARQIIPGGGGLSIFSSENILGPWGAPSNEQPFIPEGDYLSVQLPDSRRQYFSKAQYFPVTQGLRPASQETDTGKTIKIGGRTFRMFAIGSPSKRIFHLKP